MSWGGEGATGSLLYQDKRGQPAVIGSWPLPDVRVSFVLFLFSRSRKIFVRKCHSLSQCLGLSWISLSQCLMTLMTIFRGGDNDGHCTDTGPGP
jgi:hypothetical protein